MRGWVLAAGILLAVLIPEKIYAAETVPQLDWQKEIDLAETDEIFAKNAVETSFSLSGYVADVVKGKAEFSFFHLIDGLVGHLEDGMEEQKKTLLRILALAVFAGIFVRFAGTFGDRELGETGFYVVFLLMTGLVSSGFYLVFEVAKEALAHLVDFMKALIPSFSLALCYGGGTQTSLLFYETMLIAMGILEMLMSGFLLPGVQIYFFMNIVNQLAENRFSRMVELLRSVLRWSVKILFAVLLGYQGIQGMLLPVMDKVKNNALWQSAKGLPGVGNTVGSVMDTMLGSGVLIKSAVGIGGVIAIILLCIYPLLKILLFTLLYKIGSAIVQPVSDRRIAAVLQSAAASGKLLLGYVLAGALMFVLSITIVLVCTNMTMG